MRRLHPAPLALAAALFAPPVLAAEDLAGASDHPDIPRIQGTTIIGYDQSSYGEGQFHGSTEDRSLNLETAEGPLTRIVYLGPKSLSPFGALRNYQAAFEDLGEVTEIFSCRKNDCFRNLGGAFVWASDRRIPIEAGVAHYLYHQPKYYSDQIYWYGTVDAPEKRYTVSVYAATRSSEDNFADRRGFDPGQVLVHLDVIEGEAFTPTLQVIEAAEISQSLGEIGHIALYGIHFDTDSDLLQEASKSALGEIASVLADEPGLELFVVGHTDNVGGFDHNTDLSMRRARAVVASLAADHGVDSTRLHPVGVGMVAPVASNDNEEGRALNRRVELVKR